MFFEHDKLVVSIVFVLPCSHLCFTFDIELDEDLINAFVFHDIEDDFSGHFIAWGEGVGLEVYAVVGRVK